MICWPWGLFVVILVGAGCAGALAVFVWYWWLVSGPRR
jgi:hypothetical protein